MRSTEPDPIAVAVGVITAPGSRVLLSRRPAGSQHSGCWEFPGGKIEDGEGDEQALARELHEELGITVRSTEPLIALDHDYPTGSVRLYVRAVTAYTGSPDGREGQSLRWVGIRDLDRMNLLEANTPIVRALQLPRIQLISDIGRYGESQTVSRLRTWSQRERAVFQLREKDLTPAELEAVARRMRAVCDACGVPMVLNGDPGLAASLDLDGVHLSATRLMSVQERPLAAGFLVGASCHNLGELGQAARLGADYAFLSPVAHTPSHPGSDALGWSEFESLCDRARLPVYALGGMRLSQVEQARCHGAQGVAMITGAWA